MKTFDKLLGSVQYLLHPVSVSIKNLTGHLCCGFVVGKLTI